MLAILSRLSILFIIYVSRDLDYTKILSYMLFVRYLWLSNRANAE